MKRVEREASSRRMSVRSRVIQAALEAVFFALTAAAAPPSFPPGTTQFFSVAAYDAVPAAGGGVWIATPSGIVRYTEAGAGLVLPIGAGIAYNLELAPDGSIWFSTATRVARITTAGIILEQYDVPGARDIAVGSDGALWFATQDLSGGIVGRIANSAMTHFPAPAFIWSLAAAKDGAVWVLTTGFGSSLDAVQKMTATGSLTTIPLGVDVLFGELQATPDGTLYIGTGIRYGLLRLRDGATSPELVNRFNDERFLVDDSRNVWSTTLSRLRFLGGDGSHFDLQLPYDPRSGSCSNVPAYGYVPLAVDSAGELWMRVVDDAVYLPEAYPCSLPVPPPMPTLIRLDGRALIAAYAATDPAVPALSPRLLLALAILLAACGAFLVARR